VKIAYLFPSFAWEEENVTLIDEVSKDGLKYVLASL
jgi:hypothetical protein